uniref:Uncharacterized protein n=1 Tax=Malurus cyaneus samueli TaxID=2593467 RepID=A0A8C5T1Z1_9PASS
MFQVLISFKICKKFFCRNQVTNFCLIPKCSCPRRLFQVCTTSLCWGCQFQRCFGCSYSLSSQGLPRGGAHVSRMAFPTPACCFQLGQLHYPLFFFLLETNKLLNKKELKAVRAVCVEHKLTMKGSCFTA